MKKTVLLASVAALALCVGGAASAAPKHPTVAAKTTSSKAQFKAANRALSVLYDQNSDSEGYADISQNFESTFDQYDSQGADDFTVPEGSKWVIKEVDVTGLYFNGPGLARSENVFFYKTNRSGKKLNLVAEFDEVAGTDDGVGNFVMNLGKDGARLKQGHYYVSVQANMDFQVGGEWGWATRNTQEGNFALWQNPGDGFGTGCTTWSQENVCLENGGVIVAGPDHMFTLRGKAK
jgi:hypothetical protein